MSMLYVHARLIDGTGHDPVPDGWVRVDGDRIVATGSGPVDSHGDEVHDCAGATLMPGLIDAHTHLAAVEVFGKIPEIPSPVLAARIFALMKDTLEAGFTTVRDAGFTDAGFKWAVEQGWAPGPRMLVSNGAITITGGHADMRHVHDQAPQEPTDGIWWPGAVADGEAEVRRAVRNVLRGGADQVKIMASGGCASYSDDITDVQFTPGEIRAAVEEAAARHTYVLAHTYQAESIRTCVEQGVRTIEHGYFLDEEAASLMVERGAYLVPTITTHELLARDGLEMGLTPRQVDKIKAALAGAYESLKLAHDLGVRIASGSDVLGMHQPEKARELGYKARVLTPMEAIVSATRTNAEMLRIADSVGTIEAGKLADLLVVDGDPLQDIGVLSDRTALRRVVQSGRVVSES